MSHFSYLVVFIHVLSAIVWLGGMFFIALVIVPAFKNFEPKEIKTEIISLSATRFRKIGWIAMIILLITGILNIGNRGITFEMISSGSFYSSTFGKVLVFKLILFFTMIILSAIYDFILGPRYTRSALIKPSNPDSIAKLNKKRNVISWLARFNVLIGILIVGCAVMLS